MNHLLSGLLLATTVAWATGAAAQTAQTAPPMTTTAPAVSASAPAAAATEMAEGEIRRVDLANRKVTLRHGEIKSLGMPRMTMVFQVRDGVAIDELKTGDKVRFTAAQLAGDYTITSLEVVR